MDIALAYGLNMRVEELEKMQQKRNRTAITLRKTKFERDEAKKELNRQSKIETRHNIPFVGKKPPTVDQLDR